MQPHSLDLQVEQGEASLREVVADMRSSPENDPILLAEGEILVDQLLARLPERLALVLRYRLGLVYGEEWSHERIGQEVLGGVSRETARNRQSAAVKRLKDLGATEGL